MREHTWNDTRSYAEHTWNVTRSYGVYIILFSIMWLWQADIRWLGFVGRAALIVEGDGGADVSLSPDDEVSLNMKVSLVKINNYLKCELGCTRLCFNYTEVIVMCDHTMMRQPMRSMHVLMGYGITWNQTGICHVMSTLRSTLTNQISHMSSHGALETRRYTRNLLHVGNI